MPTLKGIFRFPYSTLDNNTYGVGLQLELEVARQSENGPWKAGRRKWTDYDATGKETQMEAFLIQLRR